MTAFSVVIPAYNAESTLAATLACLDHQRERDFEVIVVDDGSTDGTGALADRLCADRPGYRVIHQQNRGLPGARNAAIAVATGRWIALLDSDDWLLPGHLELMRRLLEPDVGLTFADAFIWDEGRGRFARRAASARYRPRPLPTERWAMFRALAGVNFVYGATCFPRALALELGGFNETLVAAEDWELWLRITAAGHRVVGVNDRTAVYRHRVGQMSKDPTRMWEGQRAAMLSVLERTELPADVAADLQARIDHHAATPPGTPFWRPRWRSALGRATAWTGPLRDFRLRAPAEVTRSLGKLR